MPLAWESYAIPGHWSLAGFHGWAPLCIFIHQPPVLNECVFKFRPSLLTRMQQSGVYWHDCKGNSRQKESVFSWPASSSSHTRQSLHDGTKSWVTADDLSRWPGPQRTLLWSVSCRKRISSNSTWSMLFVLHPDENACWLKNQEEGQWRRKPRDNADSRVF